MRDVRITFVGCGNMGRSLIGGLISNGYSEQLIVGADVAEEQRKATAEQYNIKVLADNQQAIKDAEVLVLAVKPQSVREILQVMQVDVSRRPLIISVIAGVPVARISDWAGADGLPIIRAMPNTPALIGSGATALFCNPHVNQAQRDMAGRMMQGVGAVVWLDDESLMDVVTALSGCGPAYHFLFMEIMQRFAVGLGLLPAQAHELILQTALGAAQMALQDGADVAVLRRQVSSPGGATERALEVLMDGGIEDLLTATLHAAKQRSAELAVLAEGK